MMNETPTFKFALLEGLSEQFLPTRGSEKASGWDVRATSDHTIGTGQYAKISLGFRAFSPPDWWLELRPRSSSFAKKNLHALYGVIDEDYEGELVFACQYLPPANHRVGTGWSFERDVLEIKFGDAIGQLIPVRRQEMLVEQVSNEEYERLTNERNFNRGAGGFGSTTK
jgi:dUTP pyrophosphatase